jgi:hypothetical protein
MVAVLKACHALDTRLVSLARATLVRWLAFLELLPTNSPLASIRVENMEIKFMPICIWRQ